MKRITLAIGVLLVVLGVAMLSGLFDRLTPLPPMPNAAQTYERNEFAPQLRVQATRALEARGLSLSDLRAITVDPADCPLACNSGMERGLCYCRRDARGVCPAGMPAARNNRRSPCASLPASIALHGADIPADLQALSLPVPRN